MQQIQACCELRGYNALSFTPPLSPEPSTTLGETVMK